MNERVTPVRLGDGDLGPDAMVDRDVMVAMRDGVRIACDVYRPVAPRRYPVLFAVSPYLKDSVYYLGHLNATDTFYHDPQHPSHLILPVIPPTP